MKKLVALLLNVVLAASLFAFSGKNATDDEYFAFSALRSDYLKEWKSATPEQQIFLALTHNLLGSNGMSYTQLFPRTEKKRTDSYEKTCENILKSSWNIESAKDIPLALPRLDYKSNHPDSADLAFTYEKMVAALKKNTIENIDDYAVKAGFTPYERQILYFASFFKQNYDENGVIAYDLGRKLNIFRWALGCGYITWDEAWAYAEPVIKEILSRFDSWIDYTRSYIGGRLVFSMVQAMTNEEYFYQSIKSAEVFYDKFGKLIPKGFFRVNELKENPFADMWDWMDSVSQEYTAYDVLFSAYYRDNEDVIKLFGQELLSNMISYVCSEHPEDPFYALQVADKYYSAAKNGDAAENLDKAYEVLEAAFEYSERLPHDHWMYNQYKVLHYLVCIYTDHFEQVVSMYESFPILKQQNSDQYDYEYAYALYALIKDSEPDDEKIRMRNIALAILDRLSLNNDINDNVIDELRSYGNKIDIPEDPEESYRQAIEYYNNKQYQYAYTLLMNAAEKGHGLACNELGGCYLNGIGTQQSLELAFRYYSLAAERGVALGAYNVGICYALGEYVEKDMVKAARWITKAAYDDCPVAAYTIADYYRLGNGVEKNENKAFQWMEKACQLEYPGAFSDLGTYYSLGIGCEVDQKKAIEYFLKGSDLGSSLCMRKLAICYENGNGVEKDINQAAWYFNQAAKQGDGYSMYLLGSLYETSIQLRDHLKTAFYWYEKGAEIRNGPALMRIGDAYYAGEYGYEQSYEHAVEYYYAAYEEGYAPAWVAMARILHFGHGVDKNDKLAWQFLQAAVNSEVDGAAEMMQNFGWSIDKPIE